MSDQQPRSITPYQGRVPAAQAPAGQIMTPAGPAVIQIIDMPSTLGPVLAVPGAAAPRKPGGMNIMGAVLRRWWLVLMVAVIVGGGAFYAGTKMLPGWEGRTKLSWQDNTANVNGIQGTPAFQVITVAKSVLTSKDIPLLAAKDSELQALYPALFKGRDLKDPVVQADVVKQLKNLFEIACDDDKPGVPVLDVIALCPSEVEARTVANVYTRALKQYLQDQVKSGSAETLAALRNEVEEDERLLAQIQKNKAKLMADNNGFLNDSRLQSTGQEIQNLMAKQAAARVDLAAAQAAVEAFKAGGQRKPAQELERLKLIDEEKAKDSPLKAYIDQQMAAIGELTKQRAAGKTDEHPDVVNAMAAVKRAAAEVAAREAEIAGVIEKKIQRTFELQQGKTVDEARDAMDKASALLKTYESQLVTINEQARKYGLIKTQIDELERMANMVAKRHEQNFMSMRDAEMAQLKLPAAAKFNIEEWAVTKLKEDKRIKVQAGGMVGGLFLGILLALLIDRFDKRLRDPRDIEPLLGSPLLGTIPKIQELKRIKGEQARNLIAEEFRIIRTQILFANPNLQYKIIAVTSPKPGDGKTSLAVNLAISIAKAGRRVLLIDGDLRKPDVHRVFNLNESPGLAELIQGSHEPGAAIKKSEIDGLEILPAGTPITRPSELLSRPEVTRILHALGELYDHIILDTAPLLPVSDTHVLAGMVDAVICSFNADVDRDTVSLAQDILRRSRANVIGSVMNQVKYRQSGSYHRGKSSYDSYYNSPRGSRSAAGGGAAAGKQTPQADGSIATLNKSA